MFKPLQGNMAQKCFQASHGNPKIRVDIFKKNCILGSMGAALSLNELHMTARTNKIAATNSTEEFDGGNKGPNVAQLKK